MWTDGRRVITIAHIEPSRELKGHGDENSTLHNNKIRSA